MDGQLIASGPTTGGVSGATLAFGLIICVLLIIAWWKIFTKAGVAGWKSLIPIYNIYLLYKIANVSFWIWAVLPYALMLVLIGIYPDAKEMPTFAGILLIVGAIFYLIGCWNLSKGLANLFGKGTLFALGLFFLTNLFYLILGFGNFKYVGQKK